MINKKPLKSFSTGSLVALRQLEINTPPILRRIFFRLRFCCEGRIASYVTVTTKPKTDKKANKVGGLFVSSCLSLSITIANAEDAFDTKQLDTSHQHHTEKKPMEGMCGGNMRMDMKGMVMYENKDKLPKDCPEISEDITIKVIAGVKYAEQYPGTVFGFDEHQWQAKPCSRITVEFTNEDDIRHQWMIHGLPKYLYPEGMFHIEVNGQEKKTGTFIVPNSHFTYLVHCDIAQHMEKGMKAQLKVGNGRGDLPSIPGISNPTFPDKFPR